MPSLMRLAKVAPAPADDDVVVAQPAPVVASAPKPAALPIKPRREIDRVVLLMRAQYHHGPAQSPALGQAAGLTRPRGKLTLTPLRMRRLTARLPHNIYTERIPWKSL